jgi:hypothetical protein
MEMELENKAIVLPEFKYYKGEEKDPFPEDDIRRKFWWGEQMFSRLDNLEEQFKRFEKKVPRWRKWLKKHKANQSARFLKENTTCQLCIALYIALLWGKWCPYDDQEWIVEY